MKTLIKIFFIGFFFCLTLQAVGIEPVWVEHHVQAFLNELNASKGKPLEQLPIQEARQIFINMQAATKVDLSGIEVTEKTITENGQTVKLTIVRPAGMKGELPAFMYFHGGGWVLGDFQTHERLVRDLVVESGAVVVFVNFTLSPEAHYPVAINQAYAATQWVAEHGKEINVDGKRLAVVGNSTGGNMATVVALMAKNKNGPKLALQILFWPVTDANFNYPSFKEFANGYFLSANLMKWCWDNYTKDPKQREEIYASPLRATIEQLKNLPPALIVTAADDVLRDEGEAYARKLDAAGVDVTSVRYNGMIHEFGVINALANIPATRALILQASVELKKNLTRE